MEVLKEGSVPAPEMWSGEVTCNAKNQYDSEGCGAKLKITESDLVLRYYTGARLRHYYTAIQCPCCLKFNRVFPPATIWRSLHTDEHKAKATFDGFGENI